MNKEILDKVDEIIEEIENSQLYQNYLILQEKIAGNKDLMQLINKVRLMQKDVLHQKKDTKELDLLLDELNSHPLYREYNNVVYEINNIYAIIENNINNYFVKIVN